MRTIVLVSLFLFIVVSCQSQESNFPGSWLGNWKGELQWYQSHGKEPRKIQMQLTISRLDSLYTWQLSYGTDGNDHRPYILVAKDTAKGHWQIDEKNGIVLDMYYIANRLTGMFKVGNSSILNTYYMENGSLVAEFYSVTAKPIANTGKGTEDSPAVETFGIQSYQRAVLTR